MYSLKIALLTVALTVPSLSSFLDSQAECNADDCLRGLRRQSSLAFPFCSTYIGPSTRLQTSGTSRTIRPTISPSISTSTSPILLPPIPTPTYATPCTYTTRLSSACSCLLSSFPSSSPSTTDPTSTTIPTSTSRNTTTVIPTTITTITATTAVPATSIATSTSNPTPCNPNFNNGIQYSPPTFADLIQVEKQYPPLIVDAQGSSHACCIICYRTPGCLSFATGTGGGNQTTGLIGRCELNVAVEGSVAGPRVSKECPFGVILGFNGLGREVGLGPCVDWRGGGGGG